MYYTRWTCDVCGQDVFSSEHICDDCKKALPIIKTKCLHCGRETAFSMDYCNTCINNLTEIDLGRSVYNYEQPINRLIKKFKYKGAKYLKEFFSEELAKLYEKDELLKSDMVIYVPMTNKALKRRGFNQSKLLAEEFCHLTGLPLLDDVMEKTKETKRQATLSRSLRIINLEGVYKVKNKTQIKNKTVLIIDDVSTTGITAEYIAEKLKKAGAKGVKLMTVASVSVYNLV